MRPTVPMPLLLLSVLMSALLFAQPLVLAQLSTGESQLLAVTNVLGGSDGAADLLMGDLKLAYMLDAANTSLSISQYTLSSALLADLTTASLDFGAFSAGLSELEAAAFPDLQLYPITCYALVPIYRVDALGSDAPPLVLGRQTLAAIYAGQITWWNDSRLQADNPASDLPAQRITMVLPASGDTSSTVWTTALNKFLPGLNISVSNSPAWPTSLYAASLTGHGLSGQASLVISNDGSIGFSYQPVALELQVNIAYMINAAGVVAQPSALSVSFAADELGTQLRSRTTQAMDLTDGSGASDWPVTAMSFLLIDTQFSRSTCHVRQAVVEFWLWFYTSSVAAGLMANRQYAPVPSIVLTQLDVLNAVQNEVMCRGSTALPATATTTRIMGGSSVSFLSSLFANLYLGVQADIEWTVQSESDAVTLQQLVDAEIDLAFVNPNNVDAQLLKAVIDSPDFLLLPTYLTAPVVAYNPQLTDTVNVAAYALTLDLGTIGKILYSCISSWNDPIILRQNPWLVPLLPAASEASVPINKIVGCGSSIETAPNTYAMLDAINSFPADSGDDSLLTCVAALPAVVSAAFAACQSLPQYYAIYTASEDSIPALVMGIKGSIGLTQANGNAGVAYIIITDVRNGVWANTSASIAGMSACASDSFNTALLSTGLALTLSAGSVNPQCYRATQQVVAVLRADYDSTATDASGCDRGYDTLQLLQWFYTTPLVDQVVNSVDSVRVTSLAADILALYLNVLYGVTCDAETLLVTLPDAWQLSSGIAGFVNAMAALGLMACAVLCFCVVHYRHHPVMRSASPPFLFLSIAGVGLMFASAFFLVTTAMAGTCSAFSWLLNFGLTLCFAPLFAKTWRIYRIFGRKKLSVVMISNARLLMFCGALLVIEAVLLAAWQGVGQLQPILNTVTTSNVVVLSVSTGSSRFVVDSYLQCGVEAGSSKSLFVAVMVEKAAMFVFGALMAFTTRKVSSTFNESQGITLAIYNTVFTVGIIAPIILVIGAVGDVLTLLLAFALLWIAYFTAAILFVPKVMQITARQGADGQTGNTSIMASSSSSSGYVFMSLAALSTLPVLQGYLSALRKHVKQVETRVAALKGHGDKGVGQEGGQFNSGAASVSRNVSTVSRAAAASPSPGPTYSQAFSRSPALAGTPISRNVAAASPLQEDEVVAETSTTRGADRGDGEVVRRPAQSSSSIVNASSRASIG